MESANFNVNRRILVADSSCGIIQLEDDSCGVPQLEIDDFASSILSDISTVSGYEIYKIQKSYVVKVINMPEEVNIFSCENKLVFGKKVLGRKLGSGSAYPMGTWKVGKVGYFDQLIVTLWWKSM